MTSSSFKARMPSPLTQLSSEVGVWLLAISFFLITLDDFYFYSAGGPLFCFAGFFVFFALTGFRGHPDYDESFLLFPLVLAFFCLIGGIREMADGGEWLAKTGLSLMICSSIMIMRPSKQFLGACIRAIEIVIWVHVFFFMTQFLANYIFHMSFDFLVHITGEPQRTFDGDRSFLGMPIFRATGLFAEPSNYASHILVLLATRTIMAHKIESDKIAILAIVTAFLTLSTLALFMAACVALPYLRKHKGLIFFLGLFVAALVSPVLLERMNASETYDPVGTRLIFLSETLKTISLFGNGIGYLGKYLANSEMPITDSTNFVYVLYCTGPIGLFLFIFLVAKVSRRFPPMFLLLGLTKISLSHPLFWVIIFLCLVCEENTEAKLQSLTDSA